MTLCECRLYSLPRVQFRQESEKKIRKLPVNVTRMKKK